MAASGILSSTVVVLVGGVDKLADPLFYPEFPAALTPPPAASSEHLSVVGVAAAATLSLKVASHV